jgi:ABC-type dipeptide/oligopeptide/nickel transport system permease subunit
MAVIPGIFIVLTVLSLYFIGEGLREAIDPKH